MLYVASFFPWSRYLLLKVLCMTSALLYVLKNFQTFEKISFYRPSFVNIVNILKMSGYREEENINSGPLVNF